MSEVKWKLVPVEPTRDMLAAAGKYADHCAVHNYGGAPDADGTWEAMLAAAPSPAALPAGVDDGWHLGAYEGEALFSFLVAGEVVASISITKDDGIAYCYKHERGGPFKPGKVAEPLDEPEAFASELFDATAALSASAPAQEERSCQTPADGGRDG